MLVAGGLAALGELPRGTPAWTIAPQVAIGLGLALALSALTEAALEDRSPAALHGAWTIAVRHAGVVLGILVLTPVFTGDLTSADRRRPRGGLRHRAQRQPAAAAEARTGRGARAPGRAHPGLRAQPDPGVPCAASVARSAPEYRQVEAALAGQIRRAGTAAFSRAFRIAALIALAGLVPLAVARRLRSAAHEDVARTRRGDCRLARAGDGLPGRRRGSYAPQRPASPCLPHRWAPSRASMRPRTTSRSRRSTAPPVSCTPPPQTWRSRWPTRARSSSSSTRAGSATLELAAAAKSGIIRAFADGERSGEIDSTLAGILQAGAQAVPEKWLADQARHLLGAVR